MALNQSNGLQLNPLSGISGGITSLGSLYTQAQSQMIPSQYIQYVPLQYSMSTTVDEELAKRQEAQRQLSIKSLASRISQLKDVPAVKIAVRTPDYVGTLTMWRGWTISDDKLYAIGTSHAWEPRKAERATCKNCGTHAAPAKECTCGYWGFKTIELLQEALVPYIDSVKVIGSVEIWGKVIECANGFRAEYAYPKELWLLDGDLDHLSWTYGVAVRKM